MRLFRFVYLLGSFLLVIVSSLVPLNSPQINIEYDVNVFVKTVLKDVEKRNQGEVASNVAKYTNAGFIDFLKNGKLPDDLKDKIHSYARVFTRAQITEDTETIKDKKINKDLLLIMAQIRKFYYEWSIEARKEIRKLKEEFRIKAELLKKAKGEFEEIKSKYEKALRNTRAGR